MGPVLAVVATISIYQDPAHVFDGDRCEAGIAATLLAGHNASTPANYNERLVQETYFKGLASPKDVVILGSSRVMGIRKDLFGGASSYNAGVSGASLQDVVGLYEILRERALLPTHVILGLDPWMLNAQRQDQRWTALADWYERFAMVENVPSSRAKVGFLPPASPWLSAFAPAYFQQSLRDLVTQRGRRPECRATDKTEDEGALRLSDGSIVYPKEYRERAQSEVDRSAIKYAQARPIYGFESFLQIDSGLAAAFLKFLRVVQSDGVAVTILLVPYHPDAYRLMLASGQCDMLQKAESAFRDVAHKAGVRVVGSYDPSVSGLGRDAFLDGMHAKEGAITKLFKHLQNRYQDGVPRSSPP